MHSLRVPIPWGAKVLVEQGDQVHPQTILYELVQIGELIRLPVAEQLQIKANDMALFLDVSHQESVKADQVIAHIYTLWGLVDEKVKSFTDGIVEKISWLDGVVEIRAPQTVKNFSSYLSGTIKSVQNDYLEIQTPEDPIEARVGFGEKVFGELGKDIIVAKNTDELKSFIEDKDRTCRGIICFQATVDLIKSITGQEHPLVNRAGFTTDNPMPTIIVLDGFGSAQMPKDLIDKLDQHQGKAVTLFPETQVRAGSIRPTIYLQSPPR